MVGMYLKIKLNLKDANAPLALLVSLCCLRRQLGLTLPEQVESCFSPVGLRRRQERRRSFHLRSTQSLAPRSRTDGFRDDASVEHL